MQTLRKVIALSVIFVTVLSLSVAVAPQAKAAASAGDLIKMNGLSSIYYLGSDGKRYVFPNESTYFSWYSDFSSVMTIPQAELESYPLGANVTIRPGTKLVKITTSPKVYAVEPNGSLVAVPDEATAKTLYGDNWAKRVVDVADAFFTNYKISTKTLTATAYPTGSLIKTATTPDIYYIAADGKAQKIASETAFTANRFSFNNVITTTLAIPAAGADITAAVSAIVDTASGAGGTIGAGTGLTVTLSGTTAPSGTAVVGQAVAELGSFNLTAANDGAVKVNSIKVKRTGISSDTTANNVYLFDGLNRLTDGASFSSGVATFSGVGLVTVPAGQTKTITVKADIAGSAGQTFGVSINAASDIVTDGASISGSFPVSGNLQSLVAVTNPALATVVLSGTAGAGTSIQAGTIAAPVFTSTFTVTTKATTFKYARFAMVGSAQADAIQNFKLFVNGVQAGTTVASLDANGAIAFDFSTAPATLNTGSNTVELRADIIKGSSRTFAFNIQTAADLLLVDQNYNVAVAATTLPTGVTATTISAGSVSVTSDPTFNATQVVKSSAGVAYAKYTMKAFGEDMKVQTLSVVPTFGGTVAATEGFSNVSLFVDGSQVGSSKNSLVATGTSTGAQTDLTFGTTNLFTIPAGKTVTLEIRSDLTQLSSSAFTSAKLTLKAPAAAYIGVSSAATSPAAATTYTGNPTLTIVSGALTIGTNTGFQNQNALANTSNRKIGSYILQAGSAEAVRVSNIAIAMSGTTDVTLLNNLVITDVTTPVTPQATNNFPVNFTIPANGTKTIDVFADLGSIPTASTTITTITVTATGVSTNNSVGGSKLGQTVTVQAGSLAAPTLVSNAPSAQLVAGGSSVVAATYKFVATNGDATINELVFHEVGAATTTPVGTGIESVAIALEGTTAVKTFSVVPTGSDFIVTATDLGLVIPAGNQGKNVQVTVKYNPVTSAGQGGATTRVQVGLNLVSVKSTVSNVTTTTALNVASNVMVLVGSTMNVVADALTTAQPTAGLNPAAISSGYAAGADSTVMAFKVTAGATAINLKAVGFKPTYAGTLTSTSTQVVKIYSADDLNTALGADVAVGNSSQQGTYVFTNDFQIAAGTSKVFVVKADTTGLTTAGNSFRMDLTASGDTAVSTGTNWQWNDGTAATYGNGFLVKNLPVTGNTFTR